MTLQIMQNLCPANWLCLTGHCYVRSMFVEHYFVSLVVCLFVVAVAVVAVYCYYCYLLLLLFIYFILFFNWYKLDCNFFAELCKFFQFQIKC